MNFKVFDDYILCIVLKTQIVAAGKQKGIKLLFNIDEGR